MTGSLIQNLVSSPLVIAIDIVSAELTKGLSAGIPQMELLLLIVSNVLFLLLGVRFLLYKYFLKDALIDKSEAIKLNVIYIIGLCFAFVLLRLLMDVAIAATYSSYLPWYQFVSFLAIVFSIIVPAIMLMTGLTL